MAKTESVLEIPLEFSDVSGQKVFSVTNAPTNNGNYILDKSRGIVSNVNRGRRAGIAF
jgi:hypothetical protein